MKTIVALSYFHRKIGPIVFYAFPKQELDDQLSVRVANILNQTVSKGFFTFSSEDKLFMNYYFEIPSDWARGNNEKVMVSLIFDHQISAEMEQNLMNMCAEFCSKLQLNEEIYMAFYISDINNMKEDNKSIIIKNDEILAELVKELYWATIEETREKSEEEEIATLLTKRHVFLTLSKVSKGQISLEELNEWFKEDFPLLSFKELMDKLLEKQLIYITQVGFVEKYVFLSKEVCVKRIPPECLSKYLGDAPDTKKEQRLISEETYRLLEQDNLRRQIAESRAQRRKKIQELLIGDITPENLKNDIINDLLPKVQEYFNLYKNKSVRELEEDSYLLLQIVSDSRKYTILSQLRKGFYSKDELSHVLTKRSLKYLDESLEFLKQHDIVEEIKHDNESYIALKTDIQIKTKFPGDLSDLRYRGDRGGDYLYPYIFNPPTFPEDLAGALKEIPRFMSKKIYQEEFFCKYCGAFLPEGTSICPNCGSKVR